MAQALRFSFSPAYLHTHAAFLIRALLFPLLVLAFLWSLTIGAFDLSVAQVAAILCDRIGISLPWSYTARDATIVLSLRLPRTLLALAVGGSLGVAGTALQGLFRNPLVDPSLAGVSDGAALGAITIIVLGSGLLFIPPGLMPYALPVAAFAGGLAATAISSSLATHQRRTQVSLLLLAGIAVKSVAAAFSGFLVFIASDAQLRSITFWTLGSVSGATWETVFITLPLALLPAVVLLRYGTTLNALALGENEAHHLGINIQATKLTVVILTAIAVGAGVAACGIIGFVGLIVPHLLRLIIGPDNRHLLPGSLALGGILLILADAAARTVASPAELPIGIVTASLGGPMFLWLLVRQRKELMV